jgi:three-Cys-motif partner protein
VPREHRFGGEWTEEKLERLKKYLSAYTRIFTQNELASYFTTIYVDAFAGTGYRAPTAQDSSSPSLFDKDAQEFQKGSAYIALENEPSFDQFLFIEQRADFARELSGLREHFPGKASRIKIRQEEANTALRRWASETNWRTHRAVVFLDPYGMEVEWATIETLARTGAVDLWILFPLGQAVNRLLTSQPPEGAWAERLTRFFGTDEWREAFYRPSPQGNLFREQRQMERDVDFDAIGEFFLQRLRSIFPGVSRRALALQNSRHVPIYLLCFAAANAKGAQTAIKIADHILKK